MSNVCSAYKDLPVFWCVRQWNDDVLVDEDKEGQEKTESHGADNVHGRQPLKWCHVEDGPVMNFKHWNCFKGRKRNKKNNNHEFKFILQNDALNRHHNSYLTLAWDMRNICFQQDSCMCEYTEIH